MHIAKIDINGNPNVGLYGYVTDKYCLVGSEVPQRDIELMEKVFKVPVHKITIAGTSLLGIFLNGTNDMLLVPSIAFDTELKELKRLGIKHTVIEGRLTALGNNMLIGDHQGIINSECSVATKKKVSEALGFEVVEATIANLTTVGALAVVNSKGGYMNHEVSEVEKEILEKLFKFEFELGTINMGNTYLRSGILANSHGLIVGNLSSGIEISQVDRALGFIQR